MTDRFTKITFRNYKALKSYSVVLTDFNVLVGPNNAGKSTIIGAFRILSEGLRKARARKAQYIRNPSVNAWGHQVSLIGIPVATENIFTNYDDSEPAVIEFSLASQNKLKLIFPENDLCYMLCEPVGKPTNSPATFRNTYQVDIGIVPILGPVEHNEPLFHKEAARLALLTHRASRNFRNIWHHYPEAFEKFRGLIKSTWPGMDIQPPEIDRSYEKPVLHMFCPEERYPREIFWAGFGFQVWCQMLTFIVRMKESSLLIIDEPDIYLHSDLQRQLLELLRQVPADILIATHSTEILTEVEPNDLLVINKRSKSAKRIKDPTQLQTIFSVLGSNLNPTLTQLAKSRRVLFVEGKDFQILSSFARKLERQTLANRSDFAVVPVEGFNPKRVKDFSEGMEITLGTKISKAVIFDRDFRSDGEVRSLQKEFAKFAAFFHIFGGKEIENYLLISPVLTRSIQKKIDSRNEKTGESDKFDGGADQMLDDITSGMKNKVQAQYLSKQLPFLRKDNPGLDDSTLNQKLLEEFEKQWANSALKILMVPGKEVLAKLNFQLQAQHSIALTPTFIIGCMKKQEVPTEISELIENLESFRKCAI